MEVRPSVNAEIFWEGDQPKNLRKEPQEKRGNDEHGETKLRERRADFEEG